MSKEVEENKKEEIKVRGEPPIIYFYDSFTKEYIRDGFPDPDQMNIENWLYPAYTTKVEPISSKEGNTRIFNEDKQLWEYVEDHRGEVWYNKEDGQEVIIDYLGKIDETDIQKTKPVFPEPEPVMPELSRFQMKVVIRQIGKSDQDILDMIDQIPDETQKMLAELAWQEAIKFNYNSPVIQALLPNLGLNEDAIKEKWLEASKIKV